jgi:hypothetical protein
MSTESIIELAPVPVLYVPGEKEQPVFEQAPAAFDRLEAQLSSLKGRRFYGTVVDGEYRACVAQEPGDEGLAIARWTLPGGKYRRVRIADWEAHRDRIGPTVTDLRGRPDSDASRSVIEYYRSQRELQILGPVR